MSFKKKMVSLGLVSTLLLSNISFVSADATKVVTIGVDNNAEQRAKILNYFGVNENEVVLLEVNNQEERELLNGIATEAQIGTRTYSCSYVEPTKKGSGINVKVANLTWLTSSMVASVLSTMEITDADVVVASAITASGTGAITGIIKSLEKGSGQKIDEDKKEIATEELIITGDLGEEVGSDKATGIVNDIKTEIIKNNTSDTVQIAETINNVTNNYNITLNEEQQKKLEELMLKIAQQDYNYKEMKDTLNDIKNTIDEKLEDLGEDINKGFVETIKGFFTGITDWFKDLFEGSKNEDLGIVGSTNDSLLGDDVVIDATDKEAINLPSSEEIEGFFSRLWNGIKDFFNNLFDGLKGENTENEEMINEEETNENIIENTIEENNNNQINENETDTNVENEEIINETIEDSTNESIDVPSEEQNNQEESQLNSGQEENLNNENETASFADHN